MPIKTNADQPFKIHINALQNGHVDKIDLTIDLATTPLLNPEESQGLKPGKELKISGEGYLAQNELILKLKFSFDCYLSCIICNNFFSTKIEGLIEHILPLSNLRTQIFDYKDLIVENIYLNQPPFAECSQGSCPERENVEKCSRQKKGQNIYFPFENL